MIPVVFVHQRAQRKMGSKIMRCDQLAAIAERFHSDRYTVRVETLPRPTMPRRQRLFCRAMDGAVVILLKGTVSRLPPETLELLRKHARGICIDHLDAPVANLHVPDLHIAASFHGVSLLKTALAEATDLPSGIEVAHLVHHADPRLSAPAAMPDEFRLRYFGKPENTVLPKSGGVDVPLYEKDADFGMVTEIMMQTPMHYTVRGSGAREAFRARTAKPFTKGFNAAAVGANVLVDRATDDAMAYLGEDYPYLIDAASQAAIAEGIEKARDEFNGPEWKRGLEVMRAVRARSSPEAVAAQLGDILRRFV